jgi:hypothetical protein
MYLNDGKNQSPSPIQKGFGFYNKLIPVAAFYYFFFKINKAPG